MADPDYGDLKLQFPYGRSRYNQYGSFLKRKFGCRVYKVSVDAGFSCPNRDGTVAVGGCTYCDNDSFRPQSATSMKSVREQLREGIDYLKRRYGATKFIAYFQPFTNTHARLETLIPLFETAVEHPEVVGLSVGTRPDCVDDSKLAFFERLARTHFVTLEYGLQSIYDKTLVRVNRGHNYQCWIDAVNHTRNRGIWICAHLILGFPWETREEMLKTAEILSDKGLEILKLHHLHIVRNTALGSEYQKKPFRLLDFESYVDLVVDFLERLNPAIVIERVSGFAPKGQLIAPDWGKRKDEVRRSIERALAARNTYQGRLYKAVGN
jgi:radical SAM protein (TIGR01212 family)